MVALLKCCALFQQIDLNRPWPLPAEPDEYAGGKECRVGIDYHVEIDKHYYSVPHGLIRQPITARITTKTVELFHRGKRVAAHLRAYAPRRHTTVAEHMPSAHRRYAGWTQERLRRDAADIGPDTALLIETILEKKPHPEQGSAPASASSVSSSPTAASGSKPPAAVPSRSARLLHFRRLDPQEPPRPPP